MSNHTLPNSIIVRAAIFLIAFSAIFLAGCSTVRVIDSDVTAFQTWRTAPPGPGTTFRFERLPSQQANTAQHSLVEAAAIPVLAKVGLVPSDTAARFSLQVLLNSQRVERSADPFGYGGLGGFWGYPGFFGAGRFGHGVIGYGSGRGASLGLSFPFGFHDAATSQHELTLLMRDLGTQQLVFQSRAVHVGPWSDSLNLLPALLEAALRGFPQPPAGTRRINIELPKPVHGR